MTLNDLIIALGWQGGTVHQALAEVRQLREIEEALIEVLVNRVSDGYSTICRCCGGRVCTDSCISNLLTEDAKDKLRHLRKAQEE